MKRVPMNLQLFADPTPAPQPTPGTDPAPQPTQQTGAPATPPAIDYDKIQQMLNGTLAAKEDTALKAYFKQQGLSQEEAEAAMADFKAQKAQNQPDVAGMQAENAQMKQALAQAAVENAATLAAITLGIDAKSIPYVLRMADLSQAVGNAGKVNQEAVTAALNKVLEDVPALKPQAAAANGFTATKVGASGATDQQTQTTTTQKPAATKRWNRFNS